MKALYWFTLLVGLSSCGAKKASDSEQEAPLTTQALVDDAYKQSLVDDVLSYLRSDYRHEETEFFTVKRQIDSSDVSEYLTPEYGRFKDNDQVQQALRWLIRIPTKKIIPYGQERYLVKYFSDDTGGNHYPTSSYLLMAKKGEHWHIEKRLKRESDDDIDLTIKRQEGNQLIGQTSDKWGENVRDYLVEMRNDSLIKIRPLAD